MKIIFREIKVNGQPNTDAACEKLTLTNNVVKEFDMAKEGTR